MRLDIPETISSPLSSPETISLLIYINFLLISMLRDFSPVSDSYKVEKQIVSPLDAPLCGEQIGSETPPPLLSLLPPFRRIGVFVSVVVSIPQNRRSNAVLGTRGHLKRPCETRGLTIADHRGIYIINRKVTGVVISNDALNHDLKLIKSNKGLFAESI